MAVAGLVVTVRVGSDGSGQSQNNKGDLLIVIHLFMIIINKDDEIV